VPSTYGEGAADVAALEQDLADALGLKVQLTDRGGKGELTIRYGTLEQLDDLCRRLMRS
jgi:ParB family chromosome partitioning protein